MFFGEVLRGDCAKHFYMMRQYNALPIRQENINRFRASTIFDFAAL